MLMKLRIIPFKGSWLRIISYRHYEKMKKRNRFVNCQKHLHWIHLNFQNGAEPHFQKLKNGYFFENVIFLKKSVFCRLQTHHFSPKIGNFAAEFVIWPKIWMFESWILVKKWHFWRKSLNRTHFSWNDRSIMFYFKSVTVYFRFFFVC